MDVRPGCAVLGQPGYSRALLGPALHFGANLAHFCGHLCCVEMRAAGVCISPSKANKFLAAPYFPGVQRPFPPLLSWDFMDQLTSSVCTLGQMQGRAQGALQHSQPADSCYASVQNQPQTTAPTWTDRQIHLERALVILGSEKPQAGVHTTTGCSSAVQQVLQDGKVQKTQRSSKTPAQQEHKHVHFQGWCVGSRELKGSRAPFPPGAVPGRLPTVGCMKRGGC